MRMARTPRGPTAWMRAEPPHPDSAGPARPRSLAAETLGWCSQSPSPSASPSARQTDCPATGAQGPSASVPAYLPRRHALCPWSCRHRAGPAHATHSSSPSDRGPAGQSLPQRLGLWPVTPGGSSLSGSAGAAPSRIRAGGLCNTWAPTGRTSTSGQHRPARLMSWWVVPNAGASHKPVSVVHAQPVGEFKQGWQEASRPALSSLGHCAHLG